MYRELVRAVVWVAGIAWIGSASVAAPTDPKTVPGRPVKVATIPIGFGGDHEGKLKLAI
jgi:hypothetical protein